MSDFIFENILRIAKDKFELVKKKDVAEKIGANSQKMTNWKNRGVPSDSYKSIAENLGVTINTLIDEPLEFGWMDREHGKQSNDIDIESLISVATETYMDELVTIQKVSEQGELKPEHKEMIKFIADQYKDRL